MNKSTLEPSSSFRENQQFSTTAPTAQQAYGFNAVDAPIELIELGHGPSSSYSQNHVLHSIPLKWHPKITPYRMINLLTTICLGTVKAVAVQQGSENEPITLEWISSVVVFLVLFNFGTYEDRPAHHIPRYLTWLFEPDCMDGVWWLLSTIYPSFTRPNYISSEATSEPGTAYIVTTYRLLVSATVFTFGMSKAGLTYSGISTGANWIEWSLGVVITSVLYIIGLYENNNANLWSSFFGKDRAYIVRNGINSSLKFIAVVTSLTLMSFWFIIERPKADHTEIKLPFVLKAYNPSTSLLFEGGVFVFLFVLGGFVLYSALRSLVEDYRENIPTAVYNFLDRVDIMLTRIPRAPFRWLLHYAYLLRHILTLLLILAFYIPWLSFTLGNIYRTATSDPSLTIAAKWNGFVYFTMVFASFAPMALLFFFVQWAWRGMMVGIRYRMQRLGALAIRRLGRLDGERVHYAFAEFSAALYGPAA